MQKTDNTASNTISRVIHVSTESCGVRVQVLTHGGQSRKLMHAPLPSCP